MRVLHINCNYIGTTLHQLMIQNLDSLGCHNQVFVPTYNKNLAVIKPNLNVCVCECFNKWDRLFFDYKQKKIKKGLESNIEVENYDLIHAYTLFTDGNCARVLSKKYNIPYVVAIRNTDVNDFFRLMPHLRARGIQIMLDASAVFFLSSAYRNLVFSKYIDSRYIELIEKKSFIIPNGIDSYWLKNIQQKQKKINPKSIRLIYAGRIDRNKNIPTIQKAMKILNERGITSKLMVVGKVDDKKEYKKIKLDNNTQCFSPMPKEKLIGFYRDADIFVMPSFTESFGLVYAEAMSQGLPVIYSKGQGFDGQFSEGIIGYHVDPSNPEDVADGIKHIVKSYSYIQNNVAQLSEIFDWKRIAEKYVDVYKRILNI